MQLSPHKKSSWLRQIEEMHALVSDIPTTTPCAACRYHNDGVCSMWGNERIPAEAIEAGCEKFDFDADSAPF